MKLPLHSAKYKDTDNSVAIVASRTHIVGGLEYLANELSEFVEFDDVLEAGSFALRAGLAHDAEGWTQILETFGGAFPVEVQGLPEGSKVKAGEIVAIFSNTSPVKFCAHYAADIFRQKEVCLLEEVQANRQESFVQNYASLSKSMDVYGPLTYYAIDPVYLPQYDYREVEEFWDSDFVEYYSS